MWLKQLSIQHFRNYEATEIDFHSGGLIEQENPQKSTKVVSIKNLLDSKTNYK